jgi:hypothetical protein
MNALSISPFLVIDDNTFKASGRQGRSSAPSFPLPVSKSSLSPEFSDIPASVSRAIFYAFVSSMAL